MSEMHPSICRICSAHCPILVEVEDGRAVKVTGDPSNDLYEGYTCPKGRALPEQHTHPGRLLRSMKRGGTEPLRPIASERAMDEVAERVSRDRRRARAALGRALHRHQRAALSRVAGGSPRRCCMRLGSRMMFSSNTIDQPGKQIATALHGGWQAGEQDFESADTWLIVGSQSGDLEGDRRAEPEPRAKSSRTPSRAACS